MEPTPPPAGTSQRLRALPRNVWVLTATSFLTDVSSEMIVHLIPFFLANVLGVRTLAIGFIEGTAEMTASLLKLLSGRLSDRLGKRKGLTVAGYALSTLSKPFLTFAGSWPAVLLVRFVERMGKGIRTAPRDALVADSIRPEVRGLAFGIHRAGDTAGAALGLLVALAVVWLTQGNALALSPVSFHRLVWLSVLPAALAVIILVLGARDRRTAAREEQQPVLAGTRLNPRFRLFLLILLIFTLGNSADAFLILRAQERGLSIMQVLAVLFFFNVIYATSSGPAGSLSDRLGRQRLLITGWLLYTLVYLGFAFASSGRQVALLFGLYGLYYGLAEGSARAFVADLVRPEQRGTAYGLFNATVGLAALPASVLAGLLWQGLGSWPGFGPQAPFLAGAALALLATLLLLLFLPSGSGTHPTAPLS